MYKTQFVGHRNVKRWRLRNSILCYHVSSGQDPESMTISRIRGQPGFPGPLRRFGMERNRDWYGYVSTSQNDTLVRTVQSMVRRGHWTAKCLITQDGMYLLSARHFWKKFELELGLKKSNLISKVYVIISYFDANTA